MGLGLVINSYYCPLPSSQRMGSSSAAQTKSRVRVRGSAKIRVLEVSALTQNIRTWTNKGIQHTYFRVGGLV